MLRGLYHWTIRWAGARHAPVALAVVSTVESSVFPIPADVLFVPMCLARPDRAMHYAALATVTSVLGGILGWMIGFYAYELIAQPILAAYGKLEAFERLRAATGTEAILLMLVTSGLSHIPPMKVVTILSGVVAFDLKLFILSAILARGARFFALAWLLGRFGPQIARFIEQRLGVLTLALLGTLGLAYIVVKTL